MGNQAAVRPRLTPNVATVNPPIYREFNGVPFTGNSVGYSLPGIQWGTVYREFSGVKPRTLKLHPLTINEVS